MDIVSVKGMNKRFFDVDVSTIYHSLIIDVFMNDTSTFSIHRCTVCIPTHKQINPMEFGAGNNITFLRYAYISMFKSKVETNFLAVV